MGNAVYILLAALVASSMAASLPIHRSAASELHSAYVSPFGHDDEEGSGSLLKPFKTVSYALERLGDRGTIHVFPGVYTGSENFPSFTKNVTVTAYGGSTANTVFNAQASSRGFRLNGILNTLTIKGLGFTNFVGTGSTGAVYVTSGAVNVQDCSFTKISGTALGFELGNQTVSSTNFEDVATGISFGSTYTKVGSVNIRDCNFVNGGTAISIRTGPTRVIADNLHISEGSRALYWYSEYNGVVEISNTVVEGAALGMLYAYASGSGKAEIRLNKVTATRCGSSTATGGAVHVTKQVNINVASSTFQDNVAKQGGAIYCTGATVNLQNTIVRNNSADDGGAGYCADNCAFSSLGGSETANTNKEDTQPCF